MLQEKSYPTQVTSSSSSSSSTSSTSTCVCVFDWRRRDPLRVHIRFLAKESNRERKNCMRFFSSWDLVKTHALWLVKLASICPSLIRLMVKRCVEKRQKVEKRVAIQEEEEESNWTFLFPPSIEKRTHKKQLSVLLLLQNEVRDSERENESGLRRTKKSQPRK